MTRARRGTTLLLSFALLLAVLPLLPVLVWSVSSSWPFPRPVPTALTTRGLDVLLAPRSGVLSGLALSAGIGAAVTMVALLVGLPAGRALGRYRFRGRRLVRFLLLAPVIVPGLAVVLGLQVVFVRLGLSGTVAGVVLVQLVPTVPYAATLLAAGFANLDGDHERLARTLGAGPVRTTLFVTLPLLRPSLVAAALLCFLISWSDYILTLVIGGGQVKTLPLQLFSAIGGTDTTLAAALALLVVAPPMLLVGLGARTIVQGSAAGLAGLAP